MKNIILSLFGIALTLSAIQCESAALAADEKRLFVASSQVDCVSVAPMKCLRVKEIKEGAWQNFYQNIQGFQYTPGYEYEIVVKTETLPNPPADGSSIKYTLVKQISAVKK